MSYEFSIAVQQPFPWERILRYLAVRSTPVSETITAGEYLRRTAAGSVSVTFDEGAAALRCSVEGEAERAEVEPRVSRLFAVGHDPGPVDRVLSASPFLRPRIEKLPGVRPPGCWEPFELCLRVILGQQVSVKGAHTLMGRLVTRCPGLDASQVAVADLSAIGMPGRRVQTLRNLAVGVAAGDVRFDQDWDVVAGELARLPGFGPWTLRYLGIRLGRDGNSFPEQDLGLMHAVGAKTPRELLKLAEPWQPYRGFAAMYLWMVD
jgi:DNA-3-methyladenine glycosylase II